MTMLFLHFLNTDVSPDAGGGGHHLLLHNDIRQISRLAPFMETIARELKLESSLEVSLNLALEEAVTNVVMYAYPEGTDGLVDIEARPRDGAVDFIIRDDGKPFDPTEAPEADVSLGVNDRPIGGLGIYLVRHIMDSVRYERISGKNILTMTKILK